MVCEQWASSHEEAYQAVQAFMQWMCAASFSDKTQVFVMFFEPVGHAFHAAVLRTELYANLCNRYAGFFINHNPLAEDERPKVEARGGIAYTLRFLRQQYGDNLHPMLAAWENDFVAGTLTIEAVSCVGCDD